jgi:hypothetical protein
MLKALALIVFDEVIWSFKVEVFYNTIVMHNFYTCWYRFMMNLKIEMLCLLSRWEGFCTSCTTILPFGKVRFSSSSRGRQCQTPNFLNFLATPYVWIYFVCHHNKYPLNKSMQESDQLSSVKNKQKTHGRLMLL